LFIPCSGLSWLPISFFYCTLNTHYRIVSDSFLPILAGLVHWAILTGLSVVHGKSRP